MAPSVASYSAEPTISALSALTEKTTLTTPPDFAASADVDYAAGLKDGGNGKYVFAPIHEAQVSRAMIKRYVLSLAQGVVCANIHVSLGTLKACTIA